MTSPVVLVLGILTLAVACSTAFLSPIGHPANLLVIGVRGYRFTDYSKVEIPFVLMMLLIVIFILPLLWPSLHAPVINPPSMVRAVPVIQLESELARNRAA